MDLQQAEIIAARYVDLLRPYCERIEIAGSIRRRKAAVKDIEICAIPKPDSTVEINFLLVWGQLAQPLKQGMKFQQYKLKEGILLDLFLVTPPAQWGVIYTIRTGPDDFSKWIVTQQFKGGPLPSWAQVQNGAVWDGYDKIIRMPEETDFLDFLELGWIEPWEREARWRK